MGNKIEKCPLVTVLSQQRVPAFAKYLRGHQPTINKSNPYREIKGSSFGQHITHQSDSLQAKFLIENSNGWELEREKEKKTGSYLTIYSSLFDLFKVYGKSWKIRFYDKQNFGGQTAECVVDCPSVYETLKFREFQSCVVMDGAWVLYEQPNYHGHQYFLERGEYHNYTDWGATSPAAGSFRMITDF